MQKLILIILLLGAAFIAARVGIAFISRQPATAGVIDKEGVLQLGDCPTTPNCQGSQSTRTEQTVEPLTLSVSAQDAQEIIMEAIKQLGGSIVTIDKHYLHATFRTSLLAYTDDVEFLIDTPASAVQIRSASRLGVSDLGANKERINVIRQHLANKL